MRVRHAKERLILSRSPNRTSQQPPDAFERDQEAFSSLYDAHKSLVFGIAKRIVQSRSAAEDITQSVFLKLWVSRRAIDASFMARWLARVTRNAAVDVVRSKQFRHVELDRDLADVVTPGLDTAAVVVEKAHHADVRVAVARLPENCRRPIDMAYFEGLTYIEVAERLRLPLGTVKSRIRAGLVQLYRSIRAGKPEHAKGKSTLHTAMPTFDLHSA